MLDGPVVVAWFGKLQLKLDYLTTLLFVQHERQPKPMGLGEHFWKTFPPCSQEGEEAGSGDGEEEGGGQARRGQELEGGGWCR